jgi:hypothetical protein
MKLNIIQKQVHRNILFIILIIIFFVLGMLTRSAYADEPKGKKISSEPIPARPEFKPTILQTTTTTLPIIVKAKIAVIPEDGSAANVVEIPLDVWFWLRDCEAHGNYQINTGNGYYGAYQFSQSTWDSMNTGYAFAHEAPPEVQDDAAKRLQARSGWGQWPVCSKVALSKASL